MITAHQVAKLHVAIRLKNARDELSETTTSILWREEDRKKLFEIFDRLDTLFARVIPNGD